VEGVSLNGPQCVRHRPSPLTAQRGCHWEVIPLVTPRSARSQGSAVPPPLRCRDASGAGGARSAGACCHGVPPGTPVCRRQGRGGALPPSRGGTPQLHRPRALVTLGGGEWPRCEILTCRPGGQRTSPLTRLGLAGRGVAFRLPPKPSVPHHAGCMVVRRALPRGWRRADVQGRLSRNPPFRPVDVGC
jgi:hypothetical protein